MTSTSCTPRMAAAWCSSRVRTAPRLPSGTSAGSDTDPASPRDAHSRTTRAPASVRRASVPPQASDSSSGCANTARTVRPSSRGSAALSGRSSTGATQDAAIDRDILVNHPIDAEARDGALADAPPVEIEHAREIVHHVLEVREHDTGDAVVDDLAHRAAIERGDRGAAGHRLGEH